ncbi:helix-turn-helix domain-containing protein [Svornostia abyssi]|uniref:Helix-turn-helix domain-containing protein n=1 Tax=Svornostia abyssi TaxID=2898438 RepID=A0ABY5PNV9_9ACTN|nr:helix-turn-helix domain-containing protein [Parviterribacteraceae bacterium J379]
MRFSDLITDDAVLTELGDRLERHRLDRDWTQERLATEAGVGRATVQRIEGGDSVQLASILRVLRALGLLDGLEAAVPAPADQPIARLERRGHAPRRRASGTRGGPARPPADEPWRWPDEPGATP